MDNEPMPKRRRTASPPLARESSAVTQPHILPPNTQPPGGEDDKAYQLYLERAFADPRFRSTVAQIFNKYDGKTARADETIDPVLGRTYTGDGSAAGPAVGTQLDSLAHNDHLPYHLDMRQCEPKQEDTETADYQAGLNEPHGPYATGTAHLGTAPPGYVPNFADGGMPPGYAQSWYGNPFQGSGAYPSQWAGFTGQYSTPNGPPVTAGPWTAPDNFTYNSTAWPPHAMQPSPPTCHIDPALEMFVEAKNEEGTYHFAQAEESTGSYEPVTEYYFDALGRKRRRRLAQPRFSKNGRRLGRPPKSAEELGISTDRGAHDGEGEEEKNSARVVDLKPPTSEFCDDDDDTLWGELAEALQLASKATSKKRNNNSTKPSQKGENSATESDGAAEAEKDTDQGEMMLQKIQQELIDRAVRRSIAKENGDDTDVAAEGRRRSGRERKPANFGEQVSWDKVSAERRTSYKIKMHLRALSVQARRERKRKEKEEAEAAAKEKEEADKARKEKQEAEELAAATAAAAAAEKDDMGESNKAMPSTIPDSQDTVTSLPIRTTPKKPQSTQIMRQTIKNHVNSVVHFEEDDEALSDHEASAAFSIKDPAFSFKKPEIRVHSFLGENYMDTVYALSDDEAPTLLASMKRVSLGKKKKLQLGPAAVRPKETANVAMQNCPESSKHITASEEAEHHASKAPSPSPDIDTDAVLNSITDTAAVQEPPCKATESDDTTGSSIPSGGDGDDSGIDIRSEQTSCERSNRPPARDPIPAVPLFQDQNLLGAEHILDSLDVMSEAEETASSPVSEYGLATEDTQMNDADPFTSNVPASSRSTDKPPFVDEVPMYESMDTFEDLPADIPLMSEEVEMGYDQPVEPTVKALEQNTAREKSAKKQTAQGPPEAQKELPNAVFARPKPDELDIDREEESQPLPPESASVSPPARRPLPQQSKSQRSSGRQSSSTLTSKTPTQMATSKEPSPNSTGERSRLPSSSSSQTPAPDSKSGRVRKGSSSSRRSLLSLTGGEDDIESLLKRKPTASAAKSTHSAAPTPSSSSSSRKPSAASPFGSSSRQKSKSHASTSSLTRLSLGSLPSLSRDKSRSSKERQEAKERRRKSASVTPSATGSSEAKGTCGVDGYTCGRDFCFTCL